jgi:hypothetical protein
MKVVRLLGDKSVVIGYRQYIDNGSEISSDKLFLILK